MKKSLLFAFALTALATTSTAVSAATLDFGAVQGFNSGPVSVPGATITHESAGSILVGTGAARKTDGFCFLGSFGCQAGGELLFASSVTNLTFDIDGATPVSDSVTISAFLGGSLLGSETFDSGDETVNFFSGFTLDRLLFVDASTAAGVGYSTFTFDLANNGGGGGNVIPLPAAGWLLLGGLGGLTVMRRRTTAA